MFGRTGLAMLAPALVAIMVPASATAQSAFEREVLDVLNQARTHPTAFAASLKTYRAYFHANIVTLPGQPADFETAEGVAVVDETIAFLGRQQALGAMAEAPVLAAGAADHVRDQGASGDTGHQGGDGSSPGERVRRRGGGAYVAEVIAYGPVDAMDVVRQLIVDDGVADRGHRTVLYSPELRYAGVSCGPHPEFRTMCVIDLGMTPDGRNAATQVARAKVPAVR